MTRFLEMSGTVIVKSEMSNCDAEIKSSEHFDNSSAFTSISSTPLLESEGSAVA